MKRVKILHTADVHLDSPLHSLMIKEENLQETVKTATRSAFKKIVDTALSEEVAALLISGDLFDGDQLSAKIVVFVIAQFTRLQDAGIQVFYIKGNHDAKNTLTDITEFPENVHIFGGRGGRQQIRNSDIWIHGVSFNKKQVPESLLPKFCKPEPDAINIAMLHTSLARSGGHDTYAPCSVSELAGMGFDYWALGHIHKRQVHSEAPWIVMPGIPQGRDIGEEGPKSATLITIDGKDISVSEILTSAAEFIKVPVKVDGIKNDEELSRRIKDVLSNCCKDLTSEAGVIRLNINGKTERYWQILRNQDYWRETIIKQARETDCLYIETTRFDDLEEKTEGTTNTTSAIMELGNLMDKICLEPAFISRLREILDDVAIEIPSERRSRLIPDGSTTEKLVQTLLKAGATAIFAAMKKKEE
ncbi:MAG: DNA repair exonuclease [Alphaproteobacteria bacterium]|nr:DNA repair exonuclease [Alphaproteobacteria bacterium]